MKQKKAFLALSGACLSLILLTVGCGGGHQTSGGSTVTGATLAEGQGSGRMTIAWPALPATATVSRAKTVTGGGFTPLPGVSGLVSARTTLNSRSARSRLIPQATKSVVLEFFKTDPRDAGTATPAVKYYWVARPNGNAPTQITIGPLEARTYFVRVQALTTSTVASAEGTGNAPIPTDQVPVANTVTTFEIKRGRTDALLEAVLASTITSLQFTLTVDGSTTPVSGTLDPTKKYRLSVKALDAQGREVITTGNSLSWQGLGAEAVPDSTAGPSIAVRFWANARVNLVVRDLESGKEFTNTLNTAEGTFANPGSVLGVAGEVEEDGTDSDGNPLAQRGLDSGPLVEVLNTGDPLLYLTGNGPQNRPYFGFYRDPQDPNTNVDFSTSQVSAVIDIQGSLVAFAAEDNKLIETPEFVAPDTYYTAPATIAGFDSLDQNLYVGYSSGTKFNVAVIVLQINPIPDDFVPDLITITPTGTDPYLVGVNQDGDIYVRTTNNGRLEIRRYDGRGRLIGDFGPLVVSSSDSVLIAPSGRIIVGDAVFSTDGKIRLGFFPARTVPSIDGASLTIGDNIGKRGKYYYWSAYAFDPSLIGETPLFQGGQFFSADIVK